MSLGAMFAMEIFGGSIPGGGVAQAARKITEDQDGDAHRLVCQ